MKLSQLIQNCSFADTACLENTEVLNSDILDITCNSKQVKSKSLFIAVKGLDADGHEYIEDAFFNGAAAVIAQTNPKNLKNVILVKDSQMDMAWIAAQFYNHPSKEMTLIGVTGTNGKTTVTFLIESILKTCGYQTGVIGTIHVRYADKIIDTPYTTPDSIYLQKTLNDMRSAGITHVVMEVSSHGLALNRVDACHFDVGVFTNLTQDHLDFHQTMGDYFKAKKRLFTHFLAPEIQPGAQAVINMDSPKGQELFSSMTCKTIDVSTKRKAQIYTTHIRDTINGLSGTLNMNTDTIHFTSPLTGTFNLENIVCAAGAAFALNIDLNAIKTGIENCHAVPGRLERIDNRLERYLFVDYAHTPDALASVLTTLAPRAPKRIITVFGCGGDRDCKKRPLMGQVACQHSDITIITSDNPRSEHPDAIIKDITAGLDSFDILDLQTIEHTPFKKGYLVQTDRRKAIQTAIDISKPEDIILVAGKGHETYQITNAGTIHFDDKEELLHAVEQFSQRFDPIPWTADDLCAALDETPTISNLAPDFRFNGISTDSRTIDSTQVFIALKGEHFDGHAFVCELADKGIKGCIVQKGFLATLNKKTASLVHQKELILFEINDTLIGLGKLANFQRLRSNVKVLALTGSSGKTTTRNILQKIFCTRFHTHATTGNLNNEIGLPLTLLNLSLAHEWAIVEMGMNHAGEIARLSRIAVPDIAMVINTGKVHLEGLGSIENVARAKAEIFEETHTNATAIIFSDDGQRPVLEEAARKNKNIKTLMFFGSDPKADVCLSSVISGPETTNFKAQFNEQTAVFCIPSPARFMVDNCLAAISAAIAAGIDLECMQKGIKAFTPVAGRLNIYQLASGIHLIDDTYNANPVSVTQALNTLDSLGKNGHRIAVLGDMLELGKESEHLHKKIGHKIAQLEISRLFVFGPLGEHTIKGAIENGFPAENIFSGTKSRIAQKLADTVSKDTWILFKGSRGMAMENVIQEFTKNINTQF